MIFASSLNSFLSSLSLSALRLSLTQSHYPQPRKQPRNSLSVHSSMIIPIRILSVAWLFPIISLAMTLPFATNVTGEVLIHAFQVLLNLFSLCSFCSGHASLTKRMISTVTTLLSETLAADLQTIFVQSHALKLAATPLLAELTTSLGNLAGNLENVHDATAFISLLKSRYTTLGKVSFEILLEPVKISSGKIQDVHIAAKVSQALCSQSKTPLFFPSSFIIFWCADHCYS